MARMRLRTVAILLAAWWAAAGQTGKELYDTHQWFALRDLTRSTDTVSLYRGAVAYASGDLEMAERELRRASRGGSDDAVEARGLLISVAQTRGEYRKALAIIREIQAMRPGERDLDNGAAFFGALQSYPKQRVTRRRRALVRYSLREGNLFLPVSVNGRDASYIFDTGANFSVISESEAKRLGLSVSSAPGMHGSDAIGSKVEMRVAVANRVSIGGFEIRNVVFLVAADERQPFVDLPAESRGVLGFPVALAFETMRWTAGGEFEIGFKARRSAKVDGNLCFDGANPIVRGEYRGKPVNIFLDTGSTKTRLMPGLAKAFPEVLKGTKSVASTMRGVGGSAPVDVRMIPNFTVRIGGGDAGLDEVELLAEAPGGPPRFHIWAGLDLFQGRNVVLDFRSMRLGL